MAIKNGWAKARRLVSEYVSKNEGKPNKQNFSKLLMLARKFLIGYSGNITSTIVANFEKYVDGGTSLGAVSKAPISASPFTFSASPIGWPALDVLNKKIEERRSGSDTLRSDVLVDLSNLINRAGGFDSFEKYLEIVRNIKDL